MLFQNGSPRGCGRPRRARPAAQGSARGVWMPGFPSPGVRRPGEGPRMLTLLRPGWRAVPRLGARAVGPAGNWGVLAARPVFTLPPPCPSAGATPAWPGPTGQVALRTRGMPPKYRFPAPPGQAGFLTPSSLPPFLLLRPSRDWGRCRLPPSLKTAQDQRETSDPGLPQRAASGHRQPQTFSVKRWML